MTPHHSHTSVRGIFKKPNFRLPGQSNIQITEGEVRVNQRALVRKVLARYSYDFALFRELLQNADDAESEAVVIRFEADESPDVIVKWTFENTGKPFGEADWKRLTEIANGNPDSGKVGAFGVGFYTVFSVTDRPVVFSGGRKMEFYLDDTGPLRFHLSGHSTRETGAIIEIPLRKPAQRPKINDFLKFLATSITFMAKLNDIQVFWNTDCVGHISKSKQEIEPIELPITLMDADPSKKMTLELLQLRHRPITISVQTMDSIPRETKLDLSVFTITAEVKMDEDFAEELSQCMVKEQSSIVDYNLIYTGKDEYDQSFVDEQHKSIFRGLRADFDKAPLCSTIFIGHSTRQTTGICGHMASQFIPTVERESIDLVDQNIAIWNNELLYLGGFLSRAIYELELSRIQSEWDTKSKSLASDFAGLCERFIHVLNFFTFRPTTPSPKVAEKLCESFYTCTTSPLQLLSSVGIRPVSDIRRFDEYCEIFLKEVPMLSSHFSDLAMGFVRAHPDRQEIHPVTPSDVESDLQHRLLDGSTSELVAFLQWMLREGTAETAHLLNVARFRGADGKEVLLSSIRHFIDPKSQGSYIPLKSPLPHSVIPRQITETVPPMRLQQFGWTEFTVVDWLRYISLQEVRLANLEYDFTRSISWAERVLRSVCSVWSKPSMGDVREVAKSVFAREKCIPTTHGLLHFPEESCLPSSNVAKFDFPIVKFSLGHEINEDMEQLLLALGTRKHPPLRLFLAQKGLKTSDIICHLAQRGSLSYSDAEFLRSSPAFTAKGGSEPQHLSQLYPPIEIFQQLGLPLIDWGGSVEWQDTSRREVKLLYDLGLCRFPPLAEIMRLCSKDIKICEVAFGYLCKHLRSEYSDYNPDKSRNIAFVPAKIMGGVGFRKPAEVFIDRQWEILGFPVIQREYEKSVLERLGIQQHPPSSLILRRLKDVENNPLSEETARQWFEILSHHVQRFKKNELNSISCLRIVPKTTLGDKKMLIPIECYLGGSTKDDLYSSLFHFVDFGAGDKFLRVCGAKNYPTENDVATRLVSDPQEVLGLAGWKRYLEELNRLASHPGRITIETKCKMMHQPVLLGSRPCEETAKPEKSYGLWRPNEIFIVDEVQTLHQFADSIVTAPWDISRELEDFYISLGCQYLTTAVRDQYNPSGVIKDGKSLCSKYRDLVLERLPIFLYNYSHLKPGTPGSRFSGASDITVEAWQELLVSRTLAVGEEATKKRQVSATAIYESNTIQLWLTHQVEENKHDLAASLCRVFLGAENPPDVEFLTTCLGPRDVLEQRGYYKIEGRSRCLEDWRLFDAANLPVTVDPVIPDLSHRVTKETNRDSMTTEEQPTANAAPSPSPIGAQAAMTASLGGAATDIRQSHDLVNHQEHMESTVKEAIRACNRGGQVLLHRHSDQNMSKKSMEDGYCDASASVDDLRCCKLHDVEIRVAKDISDEEVGQTCTLELLTRFLDIIRRIAAIYGLSTKSYCTFYHATRSIAFNHEGTIYFNLYYFKRWHYEDVKEGKEQRALALWFLTFAHEIAHNLVADHNSEHEFWFLAVCEAHMEKFSQLAALGAVTPSEIDV